MLASLPSSPRPPQANDWCRVMIEISTELYDAYDARGQTATLIGRGIDLLLLTVFWPLSLLVIAA